MIKKLATAALYVDDQEKALEFWTKRVGFEVHREKAMGKAARWIEVGPPGAESCLVIYPKSMMHDWTQRKPSIVFECDDITKTHEELSGRGVEFTEPPREMAWGPFAIFVDPDGNEFGLRARVK